MKKLFIITLVTVVIFSCIKVKRADPALYIRGRIFLIDTTTREEMTASRANFVVKLAQDSNQANYLYSVKSNAEGYFVFDIPVKQRKEQFYAYCNGVVSTDEFVGIAKFKESADTFEAVRLRMTINLKNRSLFFLKAQDDSTKLGLPNTKVYFYTNKLLADKNATVSAAYSYTTNQVGEIRVKDIPKGSYYFNATANYGVGLNYSSSTNSVEIKYGYKSQEILLKRGS